MLHLQEEDFTLFTKAEIRISYKVDYLPRRGKLQDSLQFDLQFFKDFCTPQFNTYRKKDIIQDTSLP